MSSASAPVNVLIDPNDSVPAFRQIARQLTRAIDCGELRHGTRLPTSRALADALAIARNSVVDAYAELTASGMVESRGRSGTFVVVTTATSSRGTKQVTRSTPMLLARFTNRNSQREMSGEIDLAPGAVRVDGLPLAVWRAACREVGRHLPPADYGDPYGDRRLRESICTWMRVQRSVDVLPEQIVVTQGAGQAIELLVHTLVRPGDSCAVEDPGYPLAANILRSAGALLVPMPVDGHGACVESVLARTPVPALIHLTPAHQYPLGGRLSIPRRRMLVEGVRTHRSLVIENEYDHEFVHVGQALPPILKSAPDSVILVSTFAKALSPALRLGFIAAPVAVAAVLAGNIQARRMQVSWPAQRVVDHMLRSGELDRHLRRMRRRYTRLRQQIRIALAPLSPRVVLHGDEGGLHVALLTNSPELASELRMQLLKEGLGLDSLEHYSISQREHAGLLLGYGNLDESVLAGILSKIVKQVETLT